MRYWLLFAMFWMISSYARTVAQDPIRPFVHQQGLQILDAQNRPLKLRSVAVAPWIHWEAYLLGGSLLNKQSHVIDKFEKLLGKPEADRHVAHLMQLLITEQDVQQIAADGFNCVRVPINYRYFQTPNSSGWALLDQFVGWCQKYRIYVIVDMHDAPGGQSMLPTADPESPSLWHSEERKAATVDLWARLAEHYKNCPIIAGYDILNEPQADSAQHLVALQKRIISAIRAVDPNHMIIIEGLKMASDFSFYDAPLCENMIYSFHMYTWFGDNRARALGQYGRFAHAQNVPMWVGEYGENKLPMIDSTLAMFAAQDYIVGWSYWPWKRCEATYPCVNIIETPPLWKHVMKWVANPLANPKPRQEQVETAFAQFEQCVTHPNPNLDLIAVMRRH